MNRTRKIVVTISGLLGLFVLAMLDTMFGGLRFAGHTPNARAGLIAILLPTVCLILLGFLPRSKARMWSFVCLLPGAPLCFVIGGVAVLGQIIPQYTQQAIVHLGPTQIVTYFSDAGAWDSGEVIVQQEVPLLPGLLWVKPLSHQACLRDVQIKVLNRHHIECEYVADRTDTIDPSPEAKRDEAWVF